MKKIKIRKIENKMLFTGTKLSVMHSLLIILQEYLENNGIDSVIDVQNLLTVTIKEFKAIKKKFNKVEQILNI